MRTLLTLAIFLMTLFAWPVNASSVNSADLDRCMEEAINEGALINVHRMECLKAELKKQDGQLNAIYRRLMSQVKPDEKNGYKKLKDSGLSTEMLGVDTKNLWLICPLIFTLMSCFVWLN